MNQEILQDCILCDATGKILIAVISDKSKKDIGSFEGGCPLCDCKGYLRIPIEVKEK